MSFLKILRGFYNKSVLSCKIGDTCPLDAALRNKPKVKPPACHELLPGIKPTVFRETCFEKNLGPIPTIGDKAKDFKYKNPEYFSYHKYSFYDLGKTIRCVYQRQPSALKRCDEPFRLPWDDTGNDQPATLKPRCLGKCSDT